VGKGRCHCEALAPHENSLYLRIRLLPYSTLFVVVVVVKL
jgi:hypothetical protein